MPQTVALRKAALPLNLLDALHRAGHDLARMAADVGLAAEDLRRPMTEPQADQFFTLAYQRIGDPAIGLALGMQMRPELFGVVGLLALASRTFGAALERIAQYNELVSACRLDIVPGSATTEIRIQDPGPERPYSRCRMDIQMGSLLTFGRLFTERHIVPVRLTLRCPPPAYHARYAQSFSCPALFGQMHDAIVFRRADLELALVSGKPRLAALFDDEARRQLDELHRAGTTRHAVCGVLRTMLPRRAASLAHVARELHVSERTLQRRLAQENCRFSDLLDEVRRELAERYLAHGDQLADIADRLGFADPSSFFRSFKRWTGQTPERSRRPPTAPGAA